jgi:protein TonB
VAEGAGLGLDEKAIEALKGWRFKPGESGGVPVPVQASIEVNFKMM